VIYEMSLAVSDLVLSGGMEGAQGKGAAFEASFASLIRLEPYAVLRNCSKRLVLASCMRRAAAVSLISPAIRLSVATWART